jgi:hypothetical protein
LVHLDPRAGKAVMPPLPPQHHPHRDQTPLERIENQAEALQRGRAEEGLPPIVIIPADPSERAVVVREARLSAS